MKQSMKKRIAFFAMAATCVAVIAAVLRLRFGSR